MPAPQRFFDSPELLGRELYKLNVLFIVRITVVESGDTLPWRCVLDFGFNADTFNFATKEEALEEAALWLDRAENAR